TYTVTDTGDPVGTAGNALTSAPATVAVTVNPVADAPAAADAAATVAEDTADAAVDVLANDTDPDNLSPTPANTGLAVVAVTQPAHGTVTIAPSGLGVKYTPAPDYYGPDAFTY